MPNLYLFFHLNIAFSSIEEDRHLELIQNCYKPLLNLIRSCKLPTGIEVTGFTLEKINELDPTWIKDFIELNKLGYCELIGSGYSQVIGPLVPNKLTSKNLEIGNNIYSSILNINPSIALINEQAFSKNMISAYLDNGYKSIILEANNFLRLDPDQNRDLINHRQKISDDLGNEIDVIWNDTISFQKTQRFLHGEISLSKYLEYFDEKASLLQDSYFPIYGSDVEVINFRPRRFKTEAKKDANEWERFACLINELKEERKINFVKPSEVQFSKILRSSKKIAISNAAHPILVKKQPKYNISRWAVTGRDDFAINTRCWSIYNSLIEQEENDNNNWKYLCYLWSSDFRTHITQARWDKYILDLELFYNQQVPPKPSSKTIFSKNNGFFKVSAHDNDLMIEWQNKQLILNTNKGLSLKSFKDEGISPKPLFGTLEHGYFDDIEWGFDFFSCHLVLELPGAHQITDIGNVKPLIKYSDDCLYITSKLDIRIGSIKKTFVLKKLDQSIDVVYELTLNQSILGSLRCGFVTIFPESFDLNTLYYSVFNGGNVTDKFSINDHDFDHGSPISKIVSAEYVLGATDGRVQLGDEEKLIEINFNNSKNAFAPIIRNQNSNNQRLTRLLLSFREYDETSLPIQKGKYVLNYSILARKQ